MASGGVWIVHVLFSWGQELVWIYGQWIIGG